jgi:metallo-beta-lactamase family protein
MPKGTPAQRLQAGEKTVRILGEEVKVAAEVARVDAFNGIADREELLNFVNLVRDSSPDLSEVYVLPEGLDPERGFVKALEKEIRVPVKVPSYGESFGI